jgi:hypothetical protein
MPLLSILIPTKNRTPQLKSLISILSHYIAKQSIEDEIEIIVSNNSETPIESFNLEYVRIIEVEKKTDTAEENLFSLFKIAKGEYVWPLGDDDIPILESFEKLIELCRTQTYDAMIWNSRIIGIDGESLGHSRISSNQDFLAIDFDKFLERLGYWSIPAGISLTIFKNNLHNYDFMKKIEQLNSPIYSHVTYYAKIFKERKFVFVNSDLVNYQTNSHDVLPTKKNHWQTYSKSQNRFFRYPWTLGFIKHLIILENHKAIGENFLENVLDISHFGRRFKLAEKVIELIIEQRISELMGISKIKINDEEMHEMLSYLERKIPRYARSFELLRETSDSHTFKKKKAVKLLENHFRAMQIATERLPFQGYFRFVKCNFLYYETPLGWLAIKPNLADIDLKYIDRKFDVGDLSRPLNSSLKWALSGLEIPKGFEYQGETLKDLEKTLATLGHTKSSDINSELQFFLSPEKYASQNYIPQSRVRNLWNHLPLSIRRAIKKILQS